MSLYRKQGLVRWGISFGEFCILSPQLAFLVFLAFYLSWCGEYALNRKNAKTDEK